MAAIQAAAPEQAGKSGVHAHRTLALAFANERKLDLAIPHLREAVKSDPANVNVRAELGGALLQLSQIPEASKEMEEAVRLVPSDPTIRAAYGNVLAKSGDTEAGIRELVKAVELAPKVALFRITLGSALLREPGRLDAAIAMLQEAVRLEPESQLAAAALTRAEAQKRGTLETVAKLRQEAATAGSAERLMALGTGELWVGNLDAAARAFEKAVEIARPNGRAHASLAAVRYLRSDYAAAWKEVKLARAGSFEPPASLLLALKRKHSE
jgi:Tfp pilus assembly protein PilF